ncbi:MAG: hypothetical protein AB8I08_36970 [Sandaracinaceae bacterium]
MRWWIGVGLGLACLLLSGLVQPDVAMAGPARAECWDGEWRESGPPGEQHFRFRLRLISRGNTRVSGEFTWRQEHVSWHPQTDGAIGQEFVTGTRDGDRITVRGTRVSTSNLALDRYRIQVLPDGRIRGQSATLEDDWTSRLTGHAVACEPARRPGGRRVPLPG